jgi:hypothetical protein
LIIVSQLTLEAFVFSDKFSRVNIRKRDYGSPVVFCGKIQGGFIFDSISNQTGKSKYQYHQVFMFFSLGSSMNIVPVCSFDDASGLNPILNVSITDDSELYDEHHYDYDRNASVFETFRLHDGNGF